jgi:hypothetical protein
MITCPFCRETSVLKSNVESLPNNPYALHMLKFKENGKDTLKRKMEKSIELYDEKQCESTAISSEYEFRNKVKIAIRLFDENDRRISTVPWLEEGFRFQPLSSALKGSRLKNPTGFFVGVSCCLFFITTSEDPIESTTRTCSSFTNLRSGKC